MAVARRSRSEAAYHMAALQDEVRLTSTSTVEEINRVRDRLLLRARLRSIPEVNPRLPEVNPQLPEVNRMLPLPQSCSSHSGAGRMQTTEESLGQRQQAIDQAWVDLKGWAGELEQWRVYLEQPRA